MNGKKKMSLEVKGLIAGLIAGLVVLGGAFGLAAIVRSASPVPSSPPVAQVSPATSRPASGSSSGGSPADLVTLGQGLFAASCSACHGAQGQGNIGPDLQNTNLSAAEVNQKITNGIPGAMPAFGRTRTPQQIAAITAYVKTLK
jgi:cytochrome c551